VTPGRGEIVEAKRDLLRRMLKRKTQGIQGWGDFEIESRALVFAIEVRDKGPKKEYLFTHFAHRFAIARYQRELNRIGEMMGR
jgi:hypothetical protein